MKIKKLAKKANDNVGDDAKTREGEEDKLDRKKKRVVKVETM